MKITYDRKADAAYLYVKASLKRGEAAVTVPGEGEAEGINLDFDASGRLLGVEVLDARRRLPPELLKEAAAG